MSQNELRADVNGWTRGTRTRRPTTKGEALTVQARTIGDYDDEARVHAARGDVPDAPIIGKLQFDDGIRGPVRV